MTLDNLKILHIGNISTSASVLLLILIVVALSIERIYRLRNESYLAASLTKKHNDSSTDFQNPAFCPIRSEINTIPKACLKTKPEFIPAYNSSFYPIYPPIGPGPSEQTQGLKQIVLATILLRKSLIISNFTRHRHDHLSKKVTIPMSLRVDLEKLCQIIELKDLQILQAESTSAINLDKIIIVNNKESSFGREKSDTKNYLSDHSMFSNGADHFNQFSPKNKNLVVLPGIKYGGFEYYPTKEESDLVNWFREKSLFYSSNIKNRTEILGISHPHNWIFNSIHNLVDPGGAYRIKNPVTGATKPINFTEKQAIEDIRIDKSLLHKVYLATSHPKFIVNLANQFIQEIIGTKKFAGIHFRFNVGDFVNRNSMSRPDEKMFGQNGVSAEYMLHVKRSLQDFNYFFNRTISFFDKNSELSEIKTILITSPPMVADQISKVLKQKSKNEGKTFKSYKNYRIITTADTQQYLKNKEIETNCWAHRHYFGDILSTLEKQLMVQAKIFIRTRPSNWSFNVQGHRNSEGYQKVANDRVIYEIFDRRR